MSTSSLGYRLSATTGIHRGDRAYQQDQVQILPHARVPGCVMGVLADGMGGKSGGRKAADQVILTAQQLFERYAPTRDYVSVFVNFTSVSPIIVLAHEHIDAGLPPVRDHRHSPR